MTASTAPPVPHPTASRGRRLARGLAVLLAMAVPVIVMGFWFSPIGARWRADAAGQPPAEDVTTVEIVDSNFQPAAIGVAAGSEVTWQWLDSQEHNVVFADGESSAVQSSGSWSRTFDEAGDYAFSCTLHVFMDGRVVVVER